MKHFNNSKRFNNFTHKEASYDLQYKYYNEFIQKPRRIKIYVSSIDKIEVEGGLYKHNLIIYYTFYKKNYKSENSFKVDKLIHNYKDSYSNFIIKNFKSIDPSLVKLINSNDLETAQIGVTLFNNEKD